MYTKEKKLKKFKPTKEEEIKSFNLSVGDKYEIIVIFCCPFTYICNIYKTKAYVSDEFFIQGSKHELYFSYDDAYGQETASPLENVKIINKII